METNNKSSNGKVLGITGLVLGIVALVFSFIPCLGMYAFWPGIIGLVISAIGFIQANKVQASKGLAIAGIVCSIIGSAVAYYQYTKIQQATEEIQKSLESIDTSSFK